jgi:hypothetical protein
MTLLPAFLFLLLLSGAVLVWEARTGRFMPRSFWAGLSRGGLFFAAAVVGGWLLLRTFEASPLLALALVPVTGLSLVRCVVLARARWRGGLAVAALALALFAGLSASLSALPEPLDQRALFEQIFHTDTHRTPGSIDPAARRSVRL